MRIKKGDTVKIIAGANKGTVAEVLHVSVKEGLVWVEGVNMRTKHVKPSNANPEGSIQTYEAPIHVSNVAYFDAKSKGISKIGYQGKGKDKVRIVKKTGTPVDKSAKKVTKAVVKQANKKVEAKNDPSVAKLEKGPVKATKTAKKAPAAKSATAKKAPVAKGGAK